MQSSVLGKEQREDSDAVQEDSKGKCCAFIFCNLGAQYVVDFPRLTASGSGGGTNAPILSFSGDAEDMDD